MSLWEILKMLFPLAVILVILLGALYYIKKSQFKFGNGKSKNIKIDLLTTKAIMPKKYIAAVRVEGKILILGVSDYSINKLQEFDYDPQKFNSVSPRGEVEDKSFFKILKRNLREK